MNDKDPALLLTALDHCPELYRVAVDHGPVVCWHKRGATHIRLYLYKFATKCDNILEHESRTDGIV
jgi:hypothetical protein